MLHFLSNQYIIWNAVNSCLNFLLNFLSCKYFTIWADLPTLKWKPLKKKPPCVFNSLQEIITKYPHLHMLLSVKPVVTKYSRYIPECKKQLMTYMSRINLGKTYHCIRSPVLQAKIGKIPQHVKTFIGWYVPMSETK